MKDAQLAELAAEYKKMQDRIKQLESRKDRIKARLLAEMERRDTTGIITGGVKITYVKQTYVEYDEVRLKRALGPLWKNATKQVLDKDALAAVVMSGKVDVAKIEKCATEKSKAPYPVVTANG